MSFQFILPRGLSVAQLAGPWYCAVWASVQTEVMRGLIARLTFIPFQYSHIWVPITACPLRRFSHLGVNLIWSQYKQDPGQIVQTVTFQAAGLLGAWKTFCSSRASSDSDLRETHLELGFSWPLSSPFDKPELTNWQPTTTNWRGSSVEEQNVFQTPTTSPVAYD